jgi:tetratricopeptide (TPR) repeat protein
VIIVLVLVISIFKVRVGHMDGGLYPASVKQLEGLARYLIGDYRGAALAYTQQLAGQADQTASSGDYSDPVHVGQAEDISTLLRLGRAALDRGQNAQALRFFEAILEQQDNHIDGLLLTGIAQTRLRRYDDAIRSIDRALNLFTSHQPDTFFYMLRATGELHALETKERLACLLALHHRYLRIYDSSHAGLAIWYAEQAIAAGDHPDVAYLTIGIVHYREHELDQALPAFLKAIEANSEYGFAYRWASALYSDRGDLVNEYAMLKRGYEIDPKDQQLPFHFFLSEKLGDYQQALAVAVKQLESHPDDWRALFYAARMYHRTGHDAEARNHYERALRRHPQDAEFYENYGSDLYNMNLKQEALAPLQKAIALNPNKGTAYHGLGMVLEDLGRYKEAAAQYETALQLRALDEHAHLNLCLTYHLRLLDFQQAVPCYQQVLRKNPGNAIARTFLGRSQANL